MLAAYALSFVGTLTYRLGISVFGDYFAVLLFFGVLAIAMWIAFITIVGRLHDMGLSGWFWLMSAIYPPVTLPIATILLGALPGTPEPNQYGDVPGGVA